MKKTLRGAIVGYGFISSKGHVPAYLKRAQISGDVEIIAVADISEARRKLAASALPHAKIYAHYKDLFSKEAANLDFVDIAVPPMDHGEIASLALDYKLHVLCEKPLTVSVLEAEKLLEKASTVGRVIFPCHNYRHAPVVRAIGEVIESGRIGKVKSVTLNTFRNTHAKGVTEWQPHWRRFTKWGGGGIAMDHGSHSFYLAFDWLKSYPISVTAKMSNLQRDKFDTEDNFNCVLTFPTGVANVMLTWTAGVRKVIYSIQGERGGITVNDDEMEIAEIESTDGPDVAQGAVRWKVEKKSISSQWMDASHAGWFNSLFSEFVSAIEAGEFAGRQAVEALLCVETINAAYESAREQCREIKLDRSHGRSLKNVSNN